MCPQGEEFIHSTNLFLHFLEERMAVLERFIPSPETRANLSMTFMAALKCLSLCAAMARSSANAYSDRSRLSAKLRRRK